jgi:hypothetical protein
LIIRKRLCYQNVDPYQRRQILDLQVPYYPLLLKQNHSNQQNQQNQHQFILELNTTVVLISGGIINAPINYDRMDPSAPIAQ